MIRYPRKFKEQVLKRPIRPVASVEIWTLRMAYIVFIRMASSGVSRTAGGVLILSVVSVAIRCAKKALIVYNKTININVRRKMKSSCE